MFDVVFVAPISDPLCRVCAQSIADRHYGRWVFVQTYKSMRVGATLRGRPETGNLQIVHGEIPGSPHRATPTRQNLFRRASPSAPSRSTGAGEQAAPTVAAKVCSCVENAAFFQFIINFLYNLLFVTDFKITAQLHKLAENPHRVWVYRCAVFVQFQKKLHKLHPLFA